MSLRIEQSFQKSLQQVRGRVSFETSLAPLTWLRVGGGAQVLIKPRDIEDLIYIQHVAHEHQYPVTVLGVGSNVIVRDGGIFGIVIKLGGAFFSGIHLQDGGCIKVGAGALDRTVAESSCLWGLGGMEFLVGIPGTIGGAVFMNAGAYGRQMKDILVAVKGVTKEGKYLSLTNSQCGFGYRSSLLPEGFVVTEAILQGDPQDSVPIEAKMMEYLQKRQDTQPLRARTCGSTFKNPLEGPKAWQLIDAAGCRGMQVGAAKVSEMHANFLLNLGGATAQELEGLGELVRLKVFKQSGINLEWEVKRIGTAKAEDDKIWGAEESCGL